MTRSTLLALAILAGTAGVPGPARAQSDAAHYLDQFVDSIANPRDDFFQFAVGTRWANSTSNATSLPAPRSATRSW